MGWRTGYFAKGKARGLYGTINQKERRETRRIKGSLQTSGKQSEMVTGDGRGAIV